MDRLVGDEDCPRNTIVEKVFFSSANCGFVAQNWTQLLRELGITEDRIFLSNRNLDTRQSTLRDIISAALDEWRLRNGNNATLAKLVDQLENICWNNFADGLKNLFSTEPSTTTRNTLMLKNTLPEQPTYYIQRRLKTRNILSEEVFSCGSDVFVFINISRSKLSQVAKDKRTDKSSSQVCQSNVNVKFIVLDCVGDWELLRQKTSEPIHLIKYDGKKETFTWLCTSGDISNLQTHVDQHVQNQFPEDHIIDRVEASILFSRNQPVCISDSPGMGKSLLLSNIGRRLQEKYPDRIVVFIPISDFISQIEDINKEEEIFTCLFAKLCEDEATQIQFTQAIAPDAIEIGTKMELLLDGYDEVSTENQDLAKRCLKTILNNYNKTVRLWVTTRPQYLEALEKNMSVMGLHIQAFSEADQVQFLTSFWKEGESDVLDQKRLETFSRECLSKLKHKLSKKESDIAGIPLQCMMIAEVYFSDARRFSDKTNETLGLQSEIVLISSILDLYERMINTKMDKYTKTYTTTPEEKENIKRHHTYLSSQLIYPEHAFELKDTLEIKSTLPLELLVNVGLLEHGGTTEFPRFVHRTIAEFLFAKYVFQLGITSCKIQAHIGFNRFAHFLLKDVFKCSVLSIKDLKENCYTCAFKHSVVCHFLDAFLGQAEYMVGTVGNEIPISIDDTKMPLYSCIHYDFKNLFKFLHGLNLPEKYPRHYFSPEILIDATLMTSFDLLQHLFKYCCKVEINTIIVEYAEFVTPLHAAVRRGNFSIFEYILKEHKFEELVRRDECFQDLLFCAVEDTLFCSTKEIQERREIVKALVQLNNKLLKPSTPNEPPVFAEEINIELIKYLIDLGCPLTKQAGGYSLTSHATYLSAINYYELLQHIGSDRLRDLVKIESSSGYFFSLHRIVENHIATENTIRLLVSSGYDINVRDRSGETALFCTVSIFSYTIFCSTMRLLMRYGACLTIVNNENDTFIDYMVARGNVEKLKFFLDLGQVDINQINKQGDTPLLHALTARIDSYNIYEKVQLLLKNGANCKLLDFKLNSVLHLAAASETHDGLKCLRLFLNRDELDVNGKNVDGETPIHCALKVSFILKPRLPIIQLLLKHGADYTIPNQKQENVLHLCARYLHNDCLELFLKRGLLDVNQMCGSGYTPLQLVGTEIHYYFDEYVPKLEKVFRLLVSKGADINVKDGNDKKPLDNFINQWHEEFGPEKHDKHKQAYSNIVQLLSP